MGEDAIKTQADVLAMLKEHLSPLIAEHVKDAVERARKEAGTPAAVAAIQAHQEDEWSKRKAVEHARTKSGRFMRALAAANNNVLKAADYARKHFGDESVAKALAESTFVDGGALVPQNYSDEITGALRAAAVVRSLGAREVPMPNGNLTMPYVSTGVTPYAVAENQNTPPSGMTFGQMELRAKKIRAIVITSNELLEDSSPDADKFIQADMVDALRVLEDQYFIRGTGFANTPRGLKSLAATTITSANTAGGAGNSSNTDIIRDIMGLLGAVEGANIQIAKGGFIFNTRTKYALMSMREASGLFFNKDEMLRGTIWGFPYRTTQTIPSNLNDVGSLSSKESEVIFADFDKIVIGKTGELSVQVVPFAAYNDGNSVVSGLSTDQTAIAGCLRSDIGARYRGLEIAVLRGVTWGAV